MSKGLGKVAVITVVCVIVAYAFYLVNDYFALGIFRAPVSYEIRTPPAIPSSIQSALGTTEPVGTDGQAKVVDYRTEVFAENLYVPWSMVFTSPDRMLVTERNGRLRLIEAGRLAEEPYHVFGGVAARQEAGLMGAVLDPDYSSNRHLYFCLAYEKDGKVVNRVDRYTDTGTGLTGQTTILDDIPSAQYHAGCRLQAGPDGGLYVTTGDATDKSLAQDDKSLAGKILKVNFDGTIPADNPFTGSPIFSLGHRNPQGLAFHPRSGLLYATEHGPSVFDGPAGGDEINLITAGANYGWPLVSHEKSREGLASPLIVYTPAVAPAGAMFYDADVFPQFKDSFFFGLLKGEGIIRMVFSDNDPRSIVSAKKLDGIDVGRVRDVAQGPDGFIYFTTSNRDGRGTVRDGDDRIYRLVPKE